MSGMTMRGEPIHAVRHDVLFLSSPLVVGGDPSGEGQDKFPITNVGNNGDGEGIQSQGQEENQDDNLD